MRFQLLFFLLSGLFCFQSQAFVQNVTHGYPACIACHVSPNGGGLLTDYGRSLSKELMSTWGGPKGFENPFFGLTKNLNTVKFGGDFRTIQTYLENDNIDRGEQFFMQQNVELGVKYDNVMFVGTLGLQQGPDSQPNRGEFLSERHYVLWSPSPTSKLRVGKFRQTFGINTPNHTRLIKEGLGFGSNSETYNMEFTKFFETYEVTVGSSLGRIDEPRNQNIEKNISAHYTYYLNENSRLGGSVLIGESSQERRSLLGLNYVFPMGEEWIGFAELDYEKSNFTSSPQDDFHSVASFMKVGNKPFKGFMWYMLFEHLSTDSPNNYSLISSPGIGIQFLPLPHFNIQIEYVRQTTAGNSDNPNHFGWILFHTYM